MRLYPTHATVHVAIAGTGLIALAAAAKLAPVVAFGGAMLLAVAFGRALALLSVTQLREAGFEMIWAGATRVHRVGRGESLTLRVELRNRSPNAALCTNTRPIASSLIEAATDPSTLELAAGGRAELEM